MFSQASKQAKQQHSGRLLYTLWNIWKERNRRIFKGTQMTYIKVAMLALEDIRQREHALGVPQPAEGIG